MAAPNEARLEVRRLELARTLAHWRAWGTVTTPLVNRWCERARTLAIDTGVPFTQLMNQLMREADRIQSEEE